MTELAKVAIDAYKGTVQKYSVSESQDMLRQALIELNGGSTKMDYKAIRDGKCAGVFALVEEILVNIIPEGLKGDEYFNALVEFRNIALGDSAEFIVKDSTVFTVDEAAEGTQGIRRQRIGGRSTVTVKTELKAVKVYEELNRVLSGQVDFNEFINIVAEAFKQRLLNDIFALWNSATQADFGGAVFYPTAGAYNEDALLDIIAHVEAASDGKKATIIGTQKAVRHLAPSIQGSDSKSDLYNLGYYGKFYGTPVIAAPQRHQVGSHNFVFDDNVLTIIAGDQKPIKVVYEGEGTVIVGDPMNNADLTQEYLYAERYGMSLVTAGGNTGIGRYEMTN